jgi:hypothetical protein
MANSGFFKGEKKKQKKDKQGSNQSGGFSSGLGKPVFSLPEVIQKKRKGE